MRPALMGREQNGRAERWIVAANPQRDAALRLTICEPAPQAKPAKQRGNYVMRSRFMSEGGVEREDESMRRSHSATDRAIMRAHRQYGVPLPERLERAEQRAEAVRAAKREASAQISVVGTARTPARDVNHPVLVAVECVNWTKPSKSLIRASNEPRPQTKLSGQQRAMLEILRAVDDELDMFDVMRRLGACRHAMTPAARRSADNAMRESLNALVERGLVEKWAQGRGRAALTWVRWTGRPWDRE